jgi:hypothetical protein
LPRVPERVFRNASVIRRYLELWPVFVEQSLMGSDDPYDRKARGSSRPPTPEEKGLAMMGEGLLVRWDDPQPFTGEDPGREPADGRAQRALRGAISELRRSDATRVGGVPFSRVVSLLWQDPGAVPRWLAGGTKTDRAMRAAFRGHSLLLAWSLEAVCPGAVVELDPKGEELLREIGPGGKVGEARAVPKWVVEDSYRRIAEGVHALESEGYSRDAAIATKAERLGLPEPRVREAVERTEEKRSA